MMKDSHLDLAAIVKRQTDLSYMAGAKDLQCTRATHPFAVNEDVLNISSGSID
jgi:hypothetical protein